MAAARCRSISGAGVLGVLLRVVSALPNGLGRTPPMGYNTWNDLRCDGLTSARVRAAADNVVDLGLAAAGYEYVNIDDCWARELGPEGELVEDPVAFPEGMRAVADYVHSRGLKFGLYTCRGTRTCAFRPGSQNLEHLHAAQFAAWGVDFLKVDSCFASQRRDDAFADYARMRDSLNDTGRAVFLSLCGWNVWYAPRGAALGNSWRIAPDCDEWANVYVAVRSNEALAENAGPGGWNDPDMLVGSNPNAAVHFTPAQVQTQFSLWAVMASPLLIGSSLVDMPESDLATYTNPEVIAINQDPLGKQGRPVRSTCPPYTPGDNWWMAPWTMPHDVAQLWTMGLTTLLVVVGGCALMTACLPKMCTSQTARGMPGWRHSQAVELDLDDESGALDGHADAAEEPQGDAPTSATAVRRAPAQSRRWSMRAVSVALVLTLVWIPAFSYLVAIHAMKPRVDQCQQVWARRLQGGRVALCFVNFAQKPASIVCDHDCLADVGFPDGATVRDVVRREDLGDKLDAVSFTVDADGSSRLVVLSVPG